MAAPVLIDPTSPAAPASLGLPPQEHDLTRSEEEEKLLKKIREEKERLWVEIQVSESACRQFDTCLVSLASLCQTRGRGDLTLREAGSRETIVYR